MKTLELKTNTWHYFLAEIGGRNLSETDICYYTRSVILGALLMSVFVFIALLMWHVTVHTVLGAIFGVIYGTYMFTPAGEAGLIIFGIISVFVLMYLLSLGMVALQDRMKNTVINKQDNFLYHSYRSWKDKYCMRVVIKDE